MWVAAPRGNAPEIWFCSPGPLGAAWWALYCCWEAGIRTYRFFAATGSEALKAIRAQLGADAVVLSTCAREGGVEIVALTPGDLETLQAQAAVAPVPEAGVTEATEERLLRLRAANARLASDLEATKRQLERGPTGGAVPPTPARERPRGQVALELISAGFSPQAARRLVKIVGERDALPDARRKVAAVVERLLQDLVRPDDLVEAGGVFALVGPTGIGKTTTTAKLAARCVVKYGAAQVGLINSDSYRIGAQEQLLTYGRILGIQVLSVRNAVDLHAAVSRLRDKRVVLIDNTGMSQRDPRVSHQLEMLAGVSAVRTLLLLNTANRGETQDDIAAAYSSPQLAGCILTKTDEATSLAGALDVVLRRKLPIHYLSDGQRVPENLQRPESKQIAQSLFAPRDVASPWTLDLDFAA